MRRQEIKNRNEIKSNFTELKNSGESQTIPKRTHRASGKNAEWSPRNGID